MFNKHRQEIYSYYDSRKLNEMYIDYLKDMGKNIPLISFTDWDEIMKRFFDDTYMHDTYKHIIRELEGQILHVITSVVKECEEVSNTDS